MDVSNRRIVILGKTGVGKSSLANTIFGEKVFKLGETANSGTIKCEAKTKSVNGRRITLIDCPGFFDTDRSEDELKPEILRCITECAPGPHAFLIVLKVERFTEQEQAVINKINEYFSEEAFRYATVVFTNGDQLLERQTIKDFVHQNKLVSDLMEKCGGRCHVIDNKYWNQKPKQDYRSNQFQVEELLKTIDKMVMENNGSCYTNEMLQAVEENIKQEEEKIRHQKSSGNMSEKEIREQAKANAFTKLWDRLAGVRIGVLLGALGGGGLMAGLFMRILVAAGAVGGMMGYKAAGTVKNEAGPASTGAKDVLEKRVQPRTQGSGKSNRRIVILGKTGAGKSSLANTIFGEEMFKIYHTANSGTIKCEAETKSVNGRSITLIDMPGFYTDKSEDEMKPEILRCFIECAPGPHAFLIVLKVEIFTEHEQTVINKISQYFSEEAFRYATVVFTHGDQLPEGQTIEDFVHQNKKKNKLLSDLMKKCGGRCHVIDNKYWNQKPKQDYRSNQFQVEEILNTIEKMVMENNGSCYTNEMLQAVEKEIEQEEEKIRHQTSSGNIQRKRSGSMERPIDLKSSWSCNVQ